MKVNLAAVDIGSNGARLLIKSFEEAGVSSVNIGKVYFTRIPLRLGKDVFTLGKISKEKQFEMSHMLRAFVHLMRLYRVESYRACATSAMRDAENGAKIVERLQKKNGITLEIIRGEEEASLLYNNMIEKTDAGVGNFAYIDVGGGSTEISVLHDGILAESHSYNVGTLRLLSDRVPPETIERMLGDMKRVAERYPGMRIVGSGGNINKLAKLANTGKIHKEVRVDALRELRDQLKSLSICERMEKFGLREDRADVIVPAAEIFLAIASTYGCQTIVVPNISLADSIVDGLYRTRKAALSAAEGNKDRRS